MQQTTLFDEQPIGPIINVASVPQRSPFRYPGGKTWFVPYVRRWLAGFRTKPATFVEPFVGGGIIALTVAAERLAEQVIMVELDQDVAAVWQTILDPEGNEQLVGAILGFKMTKENVRHALAQPPETLLARAFQTILKNRTYHGGILAPGSSPIKQGENGRGISSRWYPETLARRIRDIATYANRITFIAGDGLDMLARYAPNPGAVFFIDPPYTMPGNGKRAGRRLYAHSELDHTELFTLAKTIRGDFLMTYDNASEVRGLAESHAFDTRVVPMKNTHHAKMLELLIGRDLAWI